MLKSNTACVSLSDIHLDLFSKVNVCVRYIMLYAFAVACAPVQYNLKLFPLTVPKV